MQRKGGGVLIYYSNQETVLEDFGFEKKGDGPPCKNILQMDIVICKLCTKSYANRLSLYIGL